MVSRSLDSDRVRYIRSYRGKDAMLAGLHPAPASYRLYTQRDAAKWGRADFIKAIYLSPRRAGSIEVIPWLDIVSQLLLYGP